MSMPKMPTFSVNDGAVCAPCRFCGYNGPDYYKAGSHAPDCPWYNIGGMDERKAALVEAMTKVSFAVDCVLRSKLMGLPLGLVPDSTKEEESVMLRKLLWLSHIGKEAILAGGLESVDCLCPRCGADFLNHSVEELAKALWRCPGEEHR
jgi:hypothetical protein